MQHTEEVKDRDPCSFNCDRCHCVIVWVSGRAATPCDHCGLVHILELNERGGLRIVSAMKAIR